MSTVSAEELRLLEETAEAIFAAHAEDEPEPGTCSPGLWNALEESGLTLLGIDEKAGGSGGGLTEAAALLRISAAAALPVPLAETAWLAAPALAAAGLPIPTGPLTAAAAASVSEHSLSAAKVSERPPTAA
ncbi:MAG: hypothetical protein GEV11_20540, partial [Streptosporangiales bacterium]|nr:hypothetical protein [Streptosporangiales bacterium]